MADCDYAAAFPWMEDVPVDAIAPPPNGRTSSSPTSSSTGCAACPPSDASGRATCSSWSATPRPASTRRAAADLDPTVTVERVTRTDARVICCGHTHIADMRELGRKLIVNPGSCGYAFDGEPAAGWALLTIPDAAAHRTTTQTMTTTSRSTRHA